MYDSQEVGSTVTGGTVSYEGVIDVRATATGPSSTLAGAISLFLSLFPFSTISFFSLSLLPPSGCPHTFPFSIDLAVVSYCAF